MHKLFLEISKECAFTICNRNYRLSQSSLWNPNSKFMRCHLLSIRHNAGRFSEKFVKIAERCKFALFINHGKV